MTNKPFALTGKEIKEIALLEKIQELWGAENPAEMEEALSKSYSVRFNFYSGGPGYVGDLFFIQGDALTGEPSVMLGRTSCPSPN